MIIIKKIACHLALMPLVLLSMNTMAAGINVTITDGSNEGFNDNASVSAIATNAGTTLGQQRRNVLAAAISFWESQLVIVEDIEMSMEMNALTCSNNSAVLGLAGPETVHRSPSSTSFPGRPNTLYVAALFNQLVGADAAPATRDLAGRFNSSLGRPGCLPTKRWHYGINDTLPANTIAFYDTVLHEIGHGLGMISLVNDSGSKFQGTDDIYSINLVNIATGEAWSSMTNAERASNSRSTNNLGWRGSNARSLAGCFTNGINNGYPRMYAPTTYTGGSVSHWDTATNPNELMEPFATTSPTSRLTLMAFKDMGWQLKNTPSRCFNTTKKETTIIPDKALLLLLN